MIGRWTEPASYCKLAPYCHTGSTQLLSRNAHVRVHAVYKLTIKLKFPDPKSCGIKPWSWKKCGPRISPKATVFNQFAELTDTSPLTCAKYFKPMSPIPSADFTGSQMAVTKLATVERCSILVLKNLGIMLFGAEKSQKTSVRTLAHSWSRDDSIQFIQLTKSNPTYSLLLLNNFNLTSNWKALEEHSHICHRLWLSMLLNVNGNCK